MNRRDDQRLHDVLASAAAIGSHLERGDLLDGLVFDAVRVRLIEIGEAVKDIDAELLATEPDIPWRAVIGMRDRLAHRYFDTAYDVVASTVAEDLPLLLVATTQGRSQQARAREVTARNLAAGPPPLLPLAFASLARTGLLATRMR